MDSRVTKLAFAVSTGLLIAVLSGEPRTLGLAPAPARPEAGAQAAAAESNWPMVAANPQRTSAVSEEVRGNVTPVWYRPIEPYINQKTQVIAADGKVFVSTARGLYAFDADTGTVLWVYPTQVPLGHSPTYTNGRLYVGSYDRTIHCIDAATGKAVAGWSSFVALAGFETNPLVANGRVYAGNRDGYFYCLNAADGGLVWRFRTGAAIRNSAAMDADGVIYFASEDLFSYALKDLGTTYLEVWKSQKMLGDTFSTYWPVIYRNLVVFSGSAGYFVWPPAGGAGQLQQDDKDGIIADLTLSTGMVSGDWVPNTVTMDASPILEYYEKAPHRRRVFLLKRDDGREFTFDSDGDGQPEYAPFTFSGTTQSGSKYPPVVGNDGVLYTNVDTRATADMWTPAGALVGWKLGTKHVSRVMDWGAKQQQAADEPMAFSVGGRVAYWALCCDRESGSFDLSIPFGQPNRYWYFWSYNQRFEKFPGYEPMYFGDDMDGWGVYGDAQGVYGKHGAQNPWVPYRGRLYRLMGNAIIAVAPGGSATAPLPLARTIPVTDTARTPGHEALKQRLDEEVQKIIAAGHLKPGLFRSNHGDSRLAGNGVLPPRIALDQGTFYFSAPGDTIYALLRSLRHLPARSQEQVRSYIQAEMLSYPIDKYASIGHVSGSPRQAGVVPPDYAANFVVDKRTDVANNLPWDFPMMAFYVAWKYSQVWPAEATRLYGNLKPKLTMPCKLDDAQLAVSGQALNAYLAGYLGYLQLEKLAGQPETAAVRAEYERLLAFRIQSLSIDAPWVPPTGGFDMYRNFVMARHFLYLVPEIADVLRQRCLPQVMAALERINAVTPYWFVEGYDATYAEGTDQQLYDVATFGAYSMILKTPYPEIVRYLDAPAFPVGDLFYIHNLADVLDAAATLAPSAPVNVRFAKQ
jgi:hypothetical protein